MWLLKNEVGFVTTEGEIISNRERKIFVRYEMDRVIIKNILFKENEIVIIACYSFLVSMGWHAVPNYAGFIAIGFLMIYSYFPLKRLTDRKPQLIIDDSGIKIIKKGLLYGWAEIKEAHVWNRGELYLSTTGEGDLWINLDDYKYSADNLKDAIEFFSGKKILNPKIKFREEIKSILFNKGNVDEVMKIFSKYKTVYLLICLPVTFGIPALAIYLQINSNFPYVFACGFVLTGVLLFALVKLLERNFKQKDELKGLSEEEFKLISTKYELKLPENKRRKLLGFILVIILTIGIFVISYIIGE